MTRINTNIKAEEDTIPFSTEELFRLKKIEEKRKSDTYELAFCGHFSAGKSTILNTLLGVELLPTSPIPTSANIIRIQNGDLQLSLETKEELKVWNGEIPWNKVREWGMNGNEISGMTIVAPLPFLGEHGQILDTPGVDSTDATHEAITVEQLYTTDAIVYVMDYNHVQSETNLFFLQQLTREKKPIFIVINQVDKHIESEISFSTFKQSIVTLLDNWGITYQSMYFTSMKNPTHPLNEFPQFEHAIKSLIYNSRDLLSYSKEFLRYGFYRSVEQRLRDEKEEKKEELITEVKNRGVDVKEFSAKEELIKTKEELFNFEDNIRRKFQKDLGPLFNDVTLFPYTTTDLARNWIASLQPGFRVGFLFSKKKTEEEQQKRLTLLKEDLQEKLKKQLLFHVQSYFQNIDRLKLTNEDEFEQALSKLTFQVSNDLLRKYVKLDYTSRDYVFVFTREITSMIVKEIRQRALSVLEVQINGMKDFIKKEQQLIDKRLMEFNELDDFYHEMEQVEKKFDQYIDYVGSFTGKLPAETIYKEQIKQVLNKSYPKQQDSSIKSITLPNETVIGTEWEEEIQYSLAFSETKAVEWLKKVKNVLAENNNVTLLSRDRRKLLERIDRYENQTYIISLFGAFSAGKSSFANALLGDTILPVSPNPTTATINTVERGSEENPHGTARVLLKTREQLSKEIKAVSEQIGESLDLQTIAGWRPKKSGELQGWEKTSLEYLSTLRDSLASSSWSLGEELVVNHDELDTLIANESKACLIDQLFIYYDCPITEKGIKLVDTPGVNSIHGRHTNVAFQQMKKSDAIFYLTYYNHAFSKADQYFLQQIGQVNESFQQDKLYFIINASDLASNEMELNGVRKHVHNQLVSNGIEKPRLYHLSSREGLRAKKEGSREEDLFSKFEEQFYNKTIMELKDLSLKLISNQLQQFYEKLNDSILFMNTDVKKKQEKQRILNQKIEKLKLEVDNASYQSVIRRVFHEYDQLVLYLRDRMKYVLHDYFTTAINVAVLTADSRKRLLEQFDAGIKEWRSLGEYFLSQELQATILRMELNIKQIVGQWMKEELSSLRVELPHITCEESLDDFSFSYEIKNISVYLERSKYHHYIKSKKDFFEQGKVKQLKEELVADGVNAASQTISLETDRIKRQLEIELTQLETSVKERLKEGLNQELMRIEALTNPVEKEALVREMKQIESVI